MVVLKFNRQRSKSMPGKYENQIEVVNKYHLTCDDPSHVYIGRGSPLGNPFRIEAGRTREQAVAAYIPYLVEASHSSGPIVEALHDIAARVQKGEHVKLVCYCKPKACHGDVVKSLVLRHLAMWEMQKWESSSIPA